MVSTLGFTKRGEEAKARKRGGLLMNCIGNLVEGTY